MRQTILAAFLLALLLTATAPAAAQKPACGPDTKGACFISLPEGDAYFLYDESFDEDGDGDVDYILHFIDGFSDFFKVLPDGRIWAHSTERQAAMIYCPFYAFDGDEFVEPDERCVYGSGHQTTNGFLDDLVGLCPGTIELRGEGYRGSDDAVFNVHGQFKAVRGPGGCSYRFRINDSMP